MWEQQLNASSRRGARGRGEKEMRERGKRGGREREEVEKERRKGKERTEGRRDGYNNYIIKVSIFNFAPAAGTQW